MYQRYRQWTRFHQMAAEMSETDWIVGKGRFKLEGK
jgi:hypothetical protein